MSGEFWKDLAAYDGKNYLLCASTPGEDNEQIERSLRKNENGLIAGHAYSLLACKTIRGHKLCKFRNPWGSMEWNGDWSDCSPLWTPEMLVSWMMTCLICLVFGIGCLTYSIFRPN